MIELGKYVEKVMEMRLINGQGRDLQAREKLDQKKVRKLAMEMKEDGQFRAIVVYTYNDTSKLREILDGAHRYAGAELLGWTVIRVIEILESEMDIETALELAYKLNSDQDTLKNNDKIFWVRKASARGMSNVKIGRIIGKSEGAVRKYLAVPDSAAQAVADGEQTISSAIGRGKTDKKMYYKPLGDKGFNFDLKFVAGKDDPQKYKEFLDKTVPEIYKQLDKALANAVSPDEAKKNKAAEREAAKAAKEEFKTKNAKLGQLGSAVKSAEQAVKDADKAGLDSASAKQHFEGLKKQHEALKAEVKELKGKLPKKTGSKAKVNKDTSPLTPASVTEPPADKSPASVEVNTQTLLTGQQLDEMEAGLKQFIQEIESGKLPPQMHPLLLKRYEDTKGVMQNHLSVPGYAEPEAAKLKRNIELICVVIETIRKKMGQ